ncbi:uncharacterized protein LOC106760291 [Vigna radiata var. radiata]|uniref:Uncharacterized protein LOC106760291 n=1 Tax=Vigna radiata var. radiata TaxID=3916 RepID=A0A1S3TZP3_VIGRR|nr:uncharacterized protein LOC106760291 [Vigna radiata var. radiata]
MAKLDDILQQFMQVSISNHKSIDAAIRSLEIQKALPPKFKDSGSFTIPCTIGDCDVGKALVDLGASLNLMSLSMLNKIGGLEVKPTRIMLQLEDRSIKYPYDVVEDVVVKIDKLQFLVDFVVMEMEENA